MILAKSAVIPFFKATVTRQELEYLDQFNAHPNLLGEKEFSGKAIKILSQYLHREVMLTKSCTQALELAAALCDVNPGDEVIMPSFGFVACANSFVAQGARLVFTDIRPDTMNIDEQLIEDAITSKTKAIVTINYSGVGCEYDVIKEIAGKNNMLIVEDNAHGILANYKGRPLGTFGDVSTISFDHLKNITCGQGGAIAINKKMDKKQLEYYYEFGTNKAEFLRGEADNYEWKSPGSNFYLSELLAAFLYAQLQSAEAIIAKFKSHWIAYVERLAKLEKEGFIGLPVVPPHCEHNAHNFFIKTKNGAERASLMAFLKSQGIYSTFHYVPLHTSTFGKQKGRFHGADRFTTKESERLLRLPLYYDLTLDDIDRVCQSVHEFYEKRNA
jgi:dTDP-4-amino-4,6-dideoxygalactose transaminase